MVCVFSTNRVVCWPAAYAAIFPLSWRTTVTVTSVLAGPNFACANSADGKSLCVDSKGAVFSSNFDQGLQQQFRVVVQVDKSGADTPTVPLFVQPISSQLASHLNCLQCGLSAPCASLNFAMSEYSRQAVTFRVGSQDNLPLFEPVSCAVFRPLPERADIGCSSLFPFSC